MVKANVRYNQSHPVAAIRRDRTAQRIRRVPSAAESTESRACRIRCPRTEILPGVRTFYITSPDSGIEYVVKRASGSPLTWICTCPDWLHRIGPKIVDPRVPRKGIDQCKHVKIVQAAVKELGLRSIPLGSEFTALVPA